MRKKAYLKNLILSVVVIAIVISGVQHFWVLAKDCAFTDIASRSEENLCLQSNLVETYSRTRDNAFEPVREVISSIRTHDKTEHHLNNRLLVSVYILWSIYSCCFSYVLLRWNCNSYIWLNHLMMIHHIHLKDGQKRIFQFPE